MQPPWPDLRLHFKHCFLSNIERQGSIVNKFKYFLELLKGNRVVSVLKISWKKNTESCITTNLFHLRQIGKKYCLSSLFSFQFVYLILSKSVDFLEFCCTWLLYQEPVLSHPNSNSWTMLFSLLDLLLLTRIWSLHL